MRKYYNSQVLKKKHIKYPFVKIGSQYWTAKNFDETVTPQGNVIANVTENANVEKITNAADREFSSDTGFWTKGVGITISGGFLEYNSAIDGSRITKNALLTANKYHKVTVIVSDYISGSLRATDNSSSSVQFNITGNGTYSTQILITNATIAIAAVSSTTLKIDSISVQEVGWSGSQELYDGIYAQTPGTVEQKTYAALKAAAMWCYYNNDANNGAIYGKLYNWYAAKLLDLDMAAANFGWRVPTSTQFTTLANTLGGNGVAGGKMKATGLDYWNSPNTGATNESGFTALGGGLRNGNDGISSAMKVQGFMWYTEGGRLYCINNSSIVDVANTTLSHGISIRLIKV